MKKVRNRFYQIYAVHYKCTRFRIAITFQRTLDNIPDFYRKKKKLHEKVNNFSANNQSLN